MSYLSVLNEANAGPEAKEILAKLKSKLGRVPNIYATMAHSPQALSGLMGFKQSLQGGVLSHKEGETIALVVGQDNGCEYCIAAHTALAKMAGFSADEAKDLRQAQSSDPKLDALVKLAKDISATRGRPGDESLKAFFDAGYDDAALVEVIAQVSINIFTNYLNHIADTEIDFPRVD